MDTVRSKEGDQRCREPGEAPQMTRINHESGGNAQKGGHAVIIR